MEQCFFFQNYKRVIRQASLGLELHAKECSVDVYNDKNRLVGTHKPIEEFTIAFLSLNRVVIFLSPRDFCSLVSLFLSFHHNLNIQ